MENLVQLKLRMPESLKLKFQKKAKKEGKSMQAVMEEAAKAYVKAKA